MIDETYTIYLKWCEDSGIKHPMSKKRLGKLLHDRGFKEGRNHDGWFRRGLRPLPNLQDLLEEAKEAKVSAKFIDELAGAASKGKLDRELHLEWRHKLDSEISATKNRAKIGMVGGKRGKAQRQTLGRVG